MIDNARRVRGVTAPYLLKEVVDCVGSETRQKVTYLLTMYGFLTPTIIGLIVFNAGAIIASFIISFFKYDVITPAKWIGLENYRWIFNSSLFWRSVTNTLRFAAGYIPLSIAASLILALLLNQKLRGLGCSVPYSTCPLLPVW